LSVINTSSLTFKTKIIGFIAAFFLIISTILAIQLTIYHDRQIEITKAIMLYQALSDQEPNTKQFDKYLKEHDLTPISINLAKKVKHAGSSIFSNKGMRETCPSTSIEIFIFENQYYYAYRQDTMYFFRDAAPMTPIKLYIIITALIVASVLFFLHRYVENSIRPLKKLHEEIKRFGRGEKNIMTQTQGNDEIAEVTNAFHDAVDTISALERGRTLFIRNLLHELKTPIQKGKLIALMQEDCNKDKVMLERIFFEMEQHLNELVKIELFTSKKITPQINVYAAIDLYEDITEKLDLSPHDIVHNVQNQKIAVDFELFSLALKNLLDNARKYATQMPIELIWNDEGIEVINIGEKLKGEFETYVEAFTRDTTHHSLEGMGLGLYITNEILEYHYFKLAYDYREGKHFFKINL
jgi:two-component system OmpR family sensor kinase